MPDARAKLLDQLAVPEGTRTFDHFGPDHALVVGTELPKPQGVFPRFVEPEGQGDAA
jgi:methionyl-tRNA synthetase